MKILLLGILLPFGLALSAAPVSIQVHAPTYPDQQVVLYRYMDAVTLRKEAIAHGRTDAKGDVTLNAEVEGTERALLRIGDVGADLFLRAGSYHVQMPAPRTDQALPISGTARVDLIFLDLDHLDVNAMVSDLNERLDAFVAEDLATDQDAGMDAVAKERSGTGTMVHDTARKQTDLFLSPRWSEARVDTFERKLRKFYADVEDPWFQSDVEYGIAGLRLGPRTTDRALFDRYLKDKPVLYNVPEYTRFFTAFFADHLMRFPFRTDTDALLKDIQEGRTDSLKALLAKNDFLKSPRLNELVLITGLYAEQGNAQFNHAGILKVFEDVREHSAFQEHRAIAANMLWDLTTMTAGTPLPALSLIDTSGSQVDIDSLFHGPVCLMITGTRGAYGEQELGALEKLRTEYDGYATFIGIALEDSPAQLATWLRTHPKSGPNWFIPADRQELLDALRVRNTPVLFLLQGRELTASPGPLPSQGLGAVLHSIRVKADEERKLRPDRGVLPPRR
ncbi:MAG: hypothetical protein IPI05_04400 [Flavobacteriales bacterium]|nr:hypothetical protein [Flavobacteriales bacterium]